MTSSTSPPSPSFSPSLAVHSHPTRPTPLIELTSLSSILGRRILAKCEHLHAGGSVKDRAANALIAKAERDGSLKAGGTVIQPTGGNTGVSMAMICAAAGYKCHLTIPENISSDKIELLETLGAKVTICPCCPFADDRHYVKVAQSLCKSTEGAVLPDQFEDTVNFEAHYTTTGPELWNDTIEATGQTVDGFCCSAGTGGTIAGVSRYLKDQAKRESEQVEVWLIDPTGSGLKSFVETGEFYSSGGCFIDGIGITRETANFAKATLDGAFRGTDREAVEMAYFLVRNEGLFVGPSAALNVCGAVKLARRLPAGSVVTTILCDGGERYRSTTYNKAWLKEKDLEPRVIGRDDLSFVLNHDE